MEKYEKTKKVQDVAGTCCCNSKPNLNPRQMFDEIVEDIAKSLAQILLICGINTTKSYQAKSIIRLAFKHHEKLRTKCSPKEAAEPRLDRDDMLQALSIRCGMQSVEAMLSYSIIKCAFKAFFHGKPPVSLSSPIVDAKALHEQQRAWMNASNVTSKLFENYQSAFFWAHKSYKEQIDIIYRALYSRMSVRCNPNEGPLCCKPVVSKKLTLKDGCHLRRASILCGLQVPPQLNTGTLVNVQLPRPLRNAEVKVPRCDHCNGRFLICECNIDQLTAEQCQDSYNVNWYRLEDEQPQPKPQWPLYEEDMVPEDKDSRTHHCSVDCKLDWSRESMNVCPNVFDGGSSNYQSCTDLSDKMVDKLEDYLIKLWAEDAAEKKNSQTYICGQDHSRHRTSL
ncbi:GL27315 [Drosophila persimilis]|uniref:GL27315 n=1 Tax=Drosophila persimilis TaxID=7234 RepID=B4GZ69_DROPE|nr:uncharacterized protein LOC6598705 [Drosophila persimilis]EDW28087.1 GL27315 [Drosophila persimilis]